MNIANLTIREIDEMVRPYVAEYFKNGTIINNYAGELFTENYTLQFDEIAVDLPEKEQFNDSDQINNASGYVYLSNVSEEYKGYEYVIILLSNAEYTKAIYLILQKISEESGKAEHIILKNFIKESEKK